MIERMKNVCLVAPASRKEDLLTKVRELGIVHLAEKKAPAGAASERFAQLSRLSLELKDYMPEGTAVHSEILSDEAFEAMNGKVLNALSLKTEKENARTAALLEAEKLKNWGDFDPAEVKALTESGMDFHFYRLGQKEFELLKNDAEVRFIRLSSVEKMDTVAVLGTLPETIPGMEFTLPEKSLSALEAEAKACEGDIAACRKVLADASLEQASYADQMLKAQNDAEFSSAVNSADGDEDLVWLTGYIPEGDAAAFTDAAKANGWAFALDDAADDDEKVPTKVKYTKLTGLMQPVFDILGTVPGYQEYDISFWFLCFFTLFFAMIIGDAGYGVLFLIGAVALTAKMKKVTNATLLLFVLSAATVVWGAMTGTWFGLEGAMKVPFLKALVVPGFANYPEYFDVTTTAAQNNVMKFCFSIGVIQLALACIMNIRRKLGAKDLSWVADLGWLLSICALYFMVLYLVIGQDANMGLIAGVVICGFLLVVIFGGMAPGKSFGQGLKSGLGDAFTVFLNTISAFGNVMSYIRLFAVGMASLAIAQSFNNMAAGFKGPLVIVGALIMIIGHVLNIVMGFLSVVVHGVRLNLLEFSGQLGMEWSGTAYDPFRKLDKIKK